MKVNCFKCKQLERVRINWRCQADEFFFDVAEEDLIMPNINCDEFEPSGKDVRELEFAACYDYAKASRLGLTQQKRWENGTPHHKMSKRLMAFLKRHDADDHDGHFDWKTGGDGDNGESLMYQMDAFFEAMDVEGTPMSKVEHLAVALGFDLPKHAKLIRCKKGFNRPRWWLTGCVGGDQVLPDTIDCETQEEAIDAALAFLTRVQG